VNGQRIEDGAREVRDPRLNSGISTRMGGEEKKSDSEGAIFLMRAAKRKGWLKKVISLGGMSRRGGTSGAENSQAGTGGSSHKKEETHTRIAEDYRRGVKGWWGGEAAHGAKKLEKRKWGKAKVKETLIVEGGWSHTPRKSCE